MIKILLLFFGKPPQEITKSIPDKKIAGSQ